MQPLIGRSLAINRRTNTTLTIECGANAAIRSSRSQTTRRWVVFQNMFRPSSQALPHLLNGDFRVLYDNEKRQFSFFLYRLYLSFFVSFSAAEVTRMPRAPRNKTQKPTVYKIVGS